MVQFRIHYYVNFSFIKIPIFSFYNLPFIKILLFSILKNGKIYVHTYVWENKPLSFFPSEKYTYTHMYEKINRSLFFPSEKYTHTHTYEKINRSLFSLWKIYVHTYVWENKPLSFFPSEKYTYTHTYEKINRSLFFPLKNYNTFFVFFSGRGGNLIPIGGAKAPPNDNKSRNVIFKLTVTLFNYL